MVIIQIIINVRQAIYYTACSQHHNLFVQMRKAATIALLITTCTNVYTYFVDRHWLVQAMLKWWQKQATTPRGTADPVICLHGRSSNPYLRWSDRCVGMCYL